MAGGDLFVMTRLAAGSMIPFRSHKSQAILEAPVLSSAEFSECGRYRYTLTRIWAPDERVVMFVGLNPSTADASRDDPTVRRCVGFARRWGFGGLVLTNLFAYRSTSPAALNEVIDPVGPDNDRHIARVSTDVDRIVLAWGIHGSLFDRDGQLLKRLAGAYCLGFTKSGAPRHPLYLPANAKLIRYRSRSRTAVCRARKRAA